MIIQLKDYPTKEKDFTEENIRNYFQTYGTILNLSLLDNNRCVIEYNDYGNDLCGYFFCWILIVDAVDCIILDSPHYFNSIEVQIEKYYSNEHLQHLERMLLSNSKIPLPGVGDDDEHVESYGRSYRYLNARIRLLNDSILSVKISNEIQFEILANGFHSTIERRKNLLEQIEQLNEQCQILHQRNEILKQLHQTRIQSNQILEENYRKDILDEENLRKSKMDLFQSLS